MIARIGQILANETVQVLGTTGGNFSTGGPITSEAFTLDGAALVVLLVRVVGTPTGTTPTLVFAVQQSNDGVNWTGVGAALANITAAGVQVTPYAAGTTQGAITSTWYRVTATPGGTNGSFTGVYADIVAQLP